MRKTIPIRIKEGKKIYQAIKKRLAKIEIKEINTKLEGSLIIFDKVIFFLPRKQKGFLFL